MSSLKKASEAFNNTFDLSEYFESVSASSLKSNLIRVIDEGKIPLVFLLGEPGVGKTYMLNIIKENYILKKRVLFSSEPFDTPESFLYFLLKNKSLSPDLPITRLKDLAISEFAYEENIIIVDEAQLLNEKVLEFIRILSDTGYFNFIISMHKDEGQEILGLQHFASRTHIVMTLEKLSLKEILNYIQAQLFKNSLGEYVEEFSVKEVKQINVYADGNFRQMKQMLKHIFSIMDYAQRNSKIGYTKPNRCVITMAAIDLGIINA
jgi:replication-associated recombination protein RarA